MNGAGHAAASVAAWGGYSLYAHLPVWQAVGGTVLALGTCMAADMDNRRFFRKLDGILPDEWLGGGGPLAHRGLLHSWLIPALLIYVAYQSPESTRWPLMALGVGWASHVLADLVFGHGGVPLFLWYWNVGLELPMGGFTEWTASLLMAVAGVAMVVGIEPSQVTALVAAMRT